VIEYVKQIEYSNHFREQHDHGGRFVVHSRDKRELPVQHATPKLIDPSQVHSDKVGGKRREISFPEGAMVENVPSDRKVVREEQINTGHVLYVRDTHLDYEFRV
jgi:hypothetical protein